jgi:hypothetical protein
VEAQDAFAARGTFSFALARARRTRPFGLRSETDLVVIADLGGSAAGTRARDLLRKGLGEHEVPSAEGRPRADAFRAPSRCPASRTSRGRARALRRDAAHARLQRSAYFAAKKLARSESRPLSRGADGSLQGDHGEPEVEVFGTCRRDGRLKVAVRWPPQGIGRSTANRPAFHPPAPACTLLDGSAGSFACSRAGQSADLVRKSVPLWRARAPPLCATARVKAPLTWPNSSLSRRLSVQRGAVDGHERTTTGGGGRGPRAPPAPAVPLSPSPARSGRGGDLPDRLVDGAHRPALADEPVGGVEVLAEPPVLALQRRQVPAARRAPPRRGRRPPRGASRSSLANGAPPARVSRTRTPSGSSNLRIGAATRARARPRPAGARRARPWR